LVRGNRKIRFRPDKIFVTSLFTYWSDHFWDSVKFYRDKFPNTPIQVGGIYVSLFFNDLNFRRKCQEFKVKPHKGILKYAEIKNKPDYSLLSANPHPIDYQIIHTSRGCIRHCQFCGTWRIEPTFVAKKSIKNEIKYRKLVFYDNNLFANPYIENILNELIELKRKNRILWCESQSGFDGRILTKKPQLGTTIKKAGFRYPRIAWDWGYSEYPKIKEQIKVLIKSGYNSKEISVFMLYNWDLTFKEMERKRIKCWNWQVQIADCRYRPLEQTFDRYNPRKIGQTGEDYYIHENADWTDALVKQFRKNVRRQNICIRHGFPFYSKDFEHKKFNEKIMRRVKKMKSKREKKKFLKAKGIHYWIPDQITYPN